MDDSPQLPIISSSSLPCLKHLRLRSSFAAAEVLLRPTLKRLDLVITSLFPATQTWLGLLRDLPLLEELCLYGATPLQDPPVTCPFAQRTNMKHMRKLQLTTYAGSASCHELLESLTLPSSKWVSTCWEWPPDDMDVPSYLSTLRRLLQYIGDTIAMEVGDSETLDACYTFRTADPRSDSSVTVMLLAITSIKYLDRILMHSMTPKLTHFTVVASGFTLPLWLATRHHPDIVEVSNKGQPAIESFVQAVVEGSAATSEGKEGGGEPADRQPFFKGLRKLEFHSSLRAKSTVDGPPQWEVAAFARLEVGLLRRQQERSYLGSLVVERQHSAVVYEKAWS